MAQIEVLHSNISRLFLNLRQDNAVCIHYIVPSRGKYIRSKFHLGISWWHSKFLCISCTLPVRFNCGGGQLAYEHSLHCSHEPYLRRSRERSINGFPTATERDGLVGESNKDVGTKTRKWNIRQQSTSDDVIVRTIDILRV
jgi:hypothetical protein